MANLDDLLNELNIDVEEGNAPPQSTDSAVDSLLNELSIDLNDVAPTASRTATAGPGPRGATSGPGPRGASSGPGPRGASSGPGPRGAASGPGPRGAASGPGPRGVASGPGPRGAASGPGPLVAPTGQKVLASGPPCKRCNEPIIGQMLSALDAKWHPHHFTCTHCDRPFPEGAFVEYEGEPYCQEDYRSLFAIKCHFCKGPIDSQVVSVEKHYWHPHHFNCVQCGCNLAGKAYKWHEDNVYCTSCIGNIIKGTSAPSVTCGRCKQPIVHGESIVFKGLPMHSYHFKCNECKKELKASEFNEWEGVFYCNQDYEKILGAICAACHKPIVGRSVSAMGKLWHPEHFICAVCSTPLGSQKFYVKDDKAYDEQHYTQLFGKICAHCDKPVLEPLQFLENFYHPEHFLCTACNLPLKKGDIEEFEGKPIHIKCFAKLPDEVRKRIAKKRAAERKEKERLAKEEKKMKKKG